MDATRMAAAQRVANELRADGRNRDGGGTADPQNNHRIIETARKTPADHSRPRDTSAS